MDRIQEHLEEFYVHLLENGYSPTASKNYRFRASTFLRRCPEALEADETEAREIVEGYIAELPRRSGKVSRILNSSCQSDMLTRYSMSVVIPNTLSCQYSQIYLNGIRLR